MSDDNHNNQSLLQEELREIKSKLGTISGKFLAMEYDERSKQLLKEILTYLRILERKAESRFYIITIFFFILYHQEYLQKLLSVIRW